MNYSDDQEEKPDPPRVIVGRSIVGAPNGESESMDAPGKDDEDRPKSPPAINRKETEEVKSEASTADETTASVEQPPPTPQINFPRPPPQSLERTVSYKQAIFEKAIGADVISMSDLRRLGWNGIPEQHRAQAWKLMLGYVPVNASRRTTNAGT